MKFRTAAAQSIGIAVLLLLTACSSTKDKDDDPAELTKFDAEVTIKRVWNVGVGSVVNKYLAGPRPTVHKGTVFAAAANGRVIAVNAETGKRLWKSKVNKGLSGGVGVGGSNVYVGDTEGQLFALNASDGVQQWQAKLSGEILSSASSDGSKVAAQTKDGWLYVLNASNGEELWKYKIQSDETTLTNNGTSSPLMIRGSVIAASANGKVYSLNAETGSVHWNQQVSAPSGNTELEKLSDIDGDMVLDGEIIYVTSYQGSVMALSRSNGGSLWDQKSSSIHGPAVTNTRVFVVEERDTIRALRSSGGQQVWESTQLKLRGLTAPVAISGYVAVADSSGYLHILSSDSGETVGRKKVDGSGVRVPMASDGKLLYVQDHDGSLSAYRITNKNK